MSSHSGSILASALLGTAVLAFAGAAPASAAQVLTTLTNDDCLVCHEEPDAARADGRKVFVDPAPFSASVHGQIGIACVDCHADVATAELPHPETLAPVDCSRCHEDETTAFGASVHGRARAAGKSAAATCVSCHGMHDILPAADPKSPTNHFNLPATCGKCHGDDALIAKAHIRGGNVASRFADSIHGAALSKMGLNVAPNCASCHGAHEIAAKTEPESRVARANVPQTCGKCHEGILAAYGRGRHGHAQEANAAKAPVCIDCHSAHQIQRADLPGWKADAIRECGTCHEDSIATYRDTFHGQVTALGFTRVATCADCHGAHEVLPKTDPASPIHAANRVATCRKCHADANANFAAYNPHADRHDQRSGRALYWSGLFMDGLLASVFCFFGLHTALWFYRSWRVVRERGSERNPAGTNGKA